MQAAHRILQDALRGGGSSVFLFFKKKFFFSFVCASHTHKLNFICFLIYAEWVIDNGDGEDDEDDSEDVEEIVVVEGENGEMIVMDHADDDDDDDDDDDEDGDDGEGDDSEDEGDVVMEGEDDDDDDDDMDDGSGDDDEDDDEDEDGVHVDEGDDDDEEDDDEDDPHEVEIVVAHGQGDDEEGEEGEEDDDESASDVDDGEGEEDGGEGDDLDIMDSEEEGEEGEEGEEEGIRRRVADPEYVEDEFDFGGDDYHAAHDDLGEDDEEGQSEQHMDEFLDDLQRSPDMQGLADMAAGNANELHMLLNRLNERGRLIPGMHPALHPLLRAGAIRRGRRTIHHLHPHHDSQHRRPGAAVTASGRGHEVPESHPMLQRQAPQGRLQSEFCLHDGEYKRVCVCVCLFVCFNQINILEFSKRFFFF